jgi:hypothetical protein
MSENENELVVQPQNQTPQGMVGVEASRAMSAFQTSMMAAKMDRRSYTKYSVAIKEACSRKRLAEAALYAYPKGGTTVTGPSIRLAEALAQAYGNLDFGIVELSQQNGESVVMAYCHDLETNVRQQKIFTVKHERHSKRGVEKLRDPRDIYELAANYGARRLRACILGVIPGDVVEEAQELCEKTMAGDGSEPLTDKIKKMVVAFSDEGVNVEMIEKRLGHKIEATIPAELVQLRKIYQSLKDGMAKRDDFFDLGKQSSEVSSTAERLNSSPEQASGVTIKEAPQKAATTTQ